MNREALFQLFPDGIYLIPEKSSAQKISPERSETSHDINGSHTDPIIAPLAIKGNNNQEVLLLYNDSEHSINPAHESFMLKMMAAVGLTLDDIAIINTIHLRDGAELEQIACKKAMLFDTPSLSWCNQSYYTVYTDGNKKLINCHALSVIESDIKYKQLLWTAMKQLFR